MNYLWIFLDFASSGISHCHYKKKNKEMFPIHQFFCLYQRHCVAPLTTSGGSTWSISATIISILLRIKKKLKGVNIQIIIMDNNLLLLTLI